MSTAHQGQFDPYAHLLNLEERIRLSGAQLPKSVDTRIQWAGVKCRIAGLNFVVQLSSVAEILEHRAITKVPGCADWVTGIVNLRGRLLPVYNPARLYGRASTRADANDSSALASPATSPQIIVVEHENIFCGIAVERIFGMQKFLQESFSAPDDILMPDCQGLAEYVEQQGIFDNQPLYQLDVFALARGICATSPAEVSQAEAVA